jgi:hypothetical protein
MSGREMETVLVVCADADRCAQVVARLHDDGASVVGSASTAGLALALTAQTAPRSAILIGETTGRRSAGELAQALSDTWGVECFVLRPDDDAALTPGMPPAIDLEALRRAQPA